VRKSIFVFAFAAGASMAAAQSLSPGDRAPAFSLPQFGGGTLTDAGFPGKIIFYNFFGST
jgi:hypothetical protein